MKRNKFIPLAVALTLCLTQAVSAAQTKYQIVPGDTLAKIAKSFGTTYQELAKLNGIQNPNLIYSGSTLIIGEDSQAPAPAPAAPAPAPEPVAPAPTPAPTPTPAPAEPAPAPVEPAADKIAFNAGTYTGEGQGFKSTIKVEVTVSDKEILDIKVIEHNDTPGVSDLAIQNLPEDILKYQSLGVDAIAGASGSSKGIIAAVTDALAKSGVSIDLLKNKAKDTQAASTEVTEKTADVVIIGGGGAGLAAAVSANQQGASVLVLEKMPRVGGNTQISGAAYNAVDPKRQKALGIEDSTEKHFTQTYEGGDKVANQTLVRVLVDNAYPAIEWLESLGMEFTDHVFTVLGGLWERAHRPVKPLGTGYIDAYLEYYENHKDSFEIMVDTKATEIIMENGRAVGVKATGKNGEVIATAKNAVVIATGGFGNSVELRDKYNKVWPTLTNIKSTNHPGATGDGLSMAEKAGANLIDLEQIQLLPMGDPQTGSLSGNIEQGVEDRIFVNKSGNRFVDEGARRDVMTKALFEQEDTMMWVILDKHSYASGDVKNNFNETIDELVAAKRAYKADTLEDLAAQIGVSPENLVKSVNAFNAAIDGTATDEFGRTLFKNKIDTAPFYAGARVPTVHHTMGGIQINEKTEVLDAKGGIIKNLFAAGEVTGGIHGANRLGGNALADITVFGRIAGTNAAKAK